MHQHKLFLCAAVLATTGVGACSTVSQKTLAPPPYEAPVLRLEPTDAKDPVASDLVLEKQYLENPTEPVRLLTRYRQAQLWSTLDPAKSCALWRDLIGQERFPLHHLARIHAMETCPAAASDPLPGIGDMLETTPEPWLKETLVRAALQRAITTGDKTWEMKLAADVSLWERTQKQRQQRLERAIALARETGNTAAEDEYRRKLHQVAPRLQPDPPPEMHMQVATDFRQAREFAKAREYYRKVVAQPTAPETERLRALDGIRMTFKLEKDQENFIKATHEYGDFARKHFLEAAKGPKDRPLLARYFETQLTLARAVWTENDPRGAERILIKLEKDFRKSQYPVNASLFIRARIAEEAGRFDDTLKILDKIDVQRPEQSGWVDKDLRSKVLWYRAWNLRKVGRRPEAIKTLEDLVAIEEPPFLVARDRFWLGRTLQENRESARATAEFEWLIENDPLGYYGILAYRELKRPIPPLGEPEIRSPAAESLPTATNALGADERMVVEWLLAVEETELAKTYLDHASAGKRSQMNDGQALDLLRLYARAGHYQTLFARLADLPPATRTAILGSEPDLIFPQPWKPAVTAAASRFGVRPELIYSIMRQESSFHPLARSHADAFGLMQLIPQMAERSRQRAGIDLSGPEDLYKPDINIQLGASFLRELLDHWRNQFVLTVASYNASERAISGWIQSRFRGDPLQFIEDIPYEETRTYIKLVLRNYVFYSRLNSGGAAIGFPEACLENLQDARL